MGSIALESANTAGSDASGDVFVQTGDSGTGDTGNLRLKIGATTGGTRGHVIVTAPAMDLLNSTELKFLNSTDTYGVGFVAPSSISADMIWTLPAADGSANQVLTTDGSGNLTWTTAAAADVSDSVFRIHDDGDITKKLSFEVSGITTGTTRTWSVPDSNLNFSTAPGGSFANSALSNLTNPTSINQSLVADTALVRSLGSGSKPWANLYNQFLWAVDGSSNTKGVLGYWSAGIKGGTQLALVGTDNNLLSIPVGLQSQDANGGGAAGAVWVGTGRGIPSADLNLFTGNYFNFATEQTGNINITTGNANIGNRGDVIVNSRALKIQDQSLASASNGYVWQLVDQTTGKGGWAAASSAAPTVEYRTLTSGEASANQLILGATPATPSKTMLDILDGGGTQEYSVEYTVSGAVLSWSAGPLAGTLVAGNRFRIVYWT
jgi:hypothetical protein